MKRKIITAIGEETLNNILREKEDVIIESTDIQYQEGIIEALEKYPDTDMIILNEEIIGELNIEDLILSITILKNDIEIILISERQENIENSKNIVKIINNKENYVNIVLKYLFEKDEIIEEVKPKVYEKQKNIITIIGKSGVRKNNFYCNTFKINQK